MQPLAANLSSLRQNLTALPPGRRMALLMTGLLSIALIVGLVLWSNQVDYGVLYAGLSSEDAGAVVKRLQEKKIPYKISPSGDTVSAPADRVPELRMELASAGLPRGGHVGYEIFDQKSLGATEFEQQLNYRRALQGELSRTIDSLDEIQQSRVHIAIPKESLFIDQQKKPTASVTLKLKSGRSLRQNQVDGVAYLVASSIEGMSPDDVLVVDSKGNILSRPPGDTRMAKMSTSQVEYQRNMEKDLAGQVQSMLENVVGKGKAVVRVSADLDFRVTEKTEETYDPESAVVRSTQKQTERNATGGGAGSAAAAPAGTAPAGSGSEREKTDETVNYEINRVVNKTLLPAGEIRKLSVAVVVDGVYTKNDKGEETFQERPKKEIEQLEDLVRKSAGLNATRGDQVAVTSMPFNRAEAEGGTSARWQDGLTPFLPFVRYIVILAAVALVILFIFRPFLRGLLAAVPAGSTEPQSLSLPTSREMPAVRREGAPPLPEGRPDFTALSHDAMVQQLAGADAKKFAELLRNWLK
ncbi:MAG: flagellar M-ring protein FliF [Syntrophaceae bacterium]|nr:flagellar M-ring protein FliF [Syntrophaceae bacterium]